MPFCHVDDVYVVSDNAHSDPDDHTEGVCDVKTRDQRYDAQACGDGDELEMQSCIAFCQNDIAVGGDHDHEGAVDRHDRQKVTHHGVAFVVEQVDKGLRHEGQKQEQRQEPHVDNRQDYTLSHAVLRGARGRFPPLRGTGPSPE